MFVVNVDLNVKPDSEDSLQRIFNTVFVPAISGQEGFAGTKLLRPNNPGTDYRLAIEFQSQTLQQKWVAQSLHQEVWPQIEDLCTNYVVKTYDSI